MAKASKDDIQELFDDIMDIFDVWPGIGPDKIQEMKDVLGLALEAEYHVGYEDGQTDAQNEDLDILSYRIHH